MARAKIASRSASVAPVSDCGHGEWRLLHVLGFRQLAREPIMAGIHEFDETAQNDRSTLLRAGLAAGGRSLNNRNRSSTSAPPRAAAHRQASARQDPTELLGQHVVDRDLVQRPAQRDGRSRAGQELRLDGLPALALHEP